MVMNVEKEYYAAPEVSVCQIAVSKVIAQSYGSPGNSGGSIDEYEIPGW